MTTPRLRQPHRVIGVVLALLAALVLVGCGDGDGGTVLDRLPDRSTTSTADGGEAAPPEDESALPERPTTTIAAEEPAEPPAEPTTTIAAEEPTAPPAEPTTTIAAEEPAEPPAEPTTTIAPEATDDDASATNPLLWVLLLAVAVVVGAIIAASRRRTGSASNAEVDASRRQLRGNLQWLHDQLSLELLAAPGDQAAVRWTTERARVDDMTIRCQEHAAGGDRDASTWRELAVATSALSRALDTAISLRATPDVDPTLVREAIAVVQRHRAELQRLLDLAATENPT